VLDDLSNARAELRESPLLYNPTTVEHLLQALAVQTQAKRTRLAVRVSLPNSGVVVEGKAFPDLPPSMLALLNQGRQTGVAPFGRALVGHRDTPWVVQGQQSVQFRVVKQKPFFQEKPLPTP
jgi:hypothetical protein